MRASPHRNHRASPGAIRHGAIGVLHAAPRPPMTSTPLSRSCLFIFLLGWTCVAAGSEGSSVCGEVPSSHAAETVIVFAPPSSFTICRKGRAQDDVVAGRRVYLMVAQRAGSSMFDFHVHGRAAEPGP